LSLQRDKLEEDGELREGQVEVLHYPQHCFRLDVGPAKTVAARSPLHTSTTKQYTNRQFLKKAYGGHLSFSTRTTLEMSSGDLPDLCRSFLPDSLCSGTYLMLLFVSMANPSAQVLNVSATPLAVAECNC